MPPDGGPGTAGGPAPLPDPAVSRARGLVLRWGWNATAYQVLNPGIGLWFAARGDAVAGYVDMPGYRVVAGAPVCARERLLAVAAELEAAARRQGRHVCYFGAGHRLEEVLRGSPRHAKVLLGAQPVWNAARWAALVGAHASLRAQLNRARNKGVVVEEWTAERAGRSAALRRCLEEWLGTRGLPPLHFMVEPDVLARLLDRRVFVAQRDGAPAGFAVASPVPARHGWLIEQWVRGRAAPNGTTELMIDAAMRALGGDGARYVTLGLSPLSRHAPPDAANPAWLRLALGWVRAHGSRFYNFRGLDGFKAKLRPDHWEPVYAIVSTRTFSPRALYAIASAFSAGSPVALLGSAVARAARQEARWLVARRP
jgi:phosphatidylglycerol lysyltransferase